jgi:subtilisin family serine protease
MSDDRRNTERPLKYDAFWHLEAIGVLKHDNSPKLPTDERTSNGVWEMLDEKAAARVAIIDTGVSPHPYMNGKLLASNPNAVAKQHNFDLTGAPSLLADSQEDEKLRAADLGDNLLMDLKLLPKSGKPEPYQVVLKEIVDNNKGRIAFNAGAPATSNENFSAHGTSCAGLVVASSVSDPNNTEGRPYYRGVDPNSEVVSITTSFAPRPELLTLAFLLAVSKEADVILFPRGLPREILFKAADFRDIGEALKWEALKQTILAVSRRIPVVCAAGNECESQPIAPACFAATDNGIIGVAAMNYNGWRSSYSNFGEGITVAAPSDDAEIFNEDQARLDRTDRFYLDHPYDFYVQKFNVKNIDYGQASILAIDVPGTFGFSDTNSNINAKLATSPESFFTEFGGTSAAASIVAGVAALMQRAAKSKNGGKPVGGKLIRQLMIETARGENDDLPHLQPGKKLTTDRVNGEDLDFGHSFGAGLISADKAVAKILADGWAPPST